MEILKIWLIYHHYTTLPIAYDGYSQWLKWHTCSDLDCLSHSSQVVKELFLDFSRLFWTFLDKLDTHVIKLKMLSVTITMLKKSVSHMILWWQRCDYMYNKLSGKSWLYQLVLVNYFYSSTVEKIWKILFQQGFYVTLITKHINCSVIQLHFHICYTLCAEHNLVNRRLTAKRKMLISFNIFIHAFHLIKQKIMTKKCYYFFFANVLNASSLCLKKFFFSEILRKNVFLQNKNIRFSENSITLHAMIFYSSSNPKS